MSLPKTAAGRVEFITQLLGGQPILDEDGEDTGEVTPAIITWEEALAILNGKDEE